MPAKSQQQLKLIYALRNKYKTKKKAPKKFKWVFDKEWTEDVKMKKLPKTTNIKERIVLSFEKFNSLNEAVIEPGEYKEDLKKALLNLDTNNINIETINNSVKDLGFKFISKQEWIDSLPDQEEKDNVPPTNNSPLGFSYAGYNYHTDDICFIGDIDAIVSTIKNINKRDIRFNDMFFNHLNMVLRHENIHKIQKSKRGDVGMTALKANPATKRDEYLSNKDEIMAHARTLLDMLLDFKSKEDVLNDLKHGSIKHPMFLDYKGIGGDVYKRFVKYIYMYLTTENK